MRTGGDGPQVVQAEVLVPWRQLHEPPQRGRYMAALQVTDGFSDIHYIHRLFALPPTLAVRLEMERSSALEAGPSY